MIFFEDGRCVDGIVNSAQLTLRDILIIARYDSGAGAGAITAQPIRKKPVVKLKRVKREIAESDPERVISHQQGVIKKLSLKRRRGNKLYSPGEGWKSHGKRRFAES